MFQEQERSVADQEVYFDEEGHQKDTSNETGDRGSPFLEHVHNAALIMQQNDLFLWHKVSYLNTLILCIFKLCVIS